MLFNLLALLLGLLVNVLDAQLLTVILPVLAVYFVVVAVIFRFIAKRCGTVSAILLLTVYTTSLVAVVYAVCLARRLSLRSSYCDFSFATYRGGILQVLCLCGIAGLWALGRFLTVEESAHEAGTVRGVAVSLPASQAEERSLASELGQQDEWFATPSAQRDATVTCSEVRLILLPLLAKLTSKIGCSGNRLLRAQEDD